MKINIPEQLRLKITCDMYNVKVYDNLDDLISGLKTYLHEEYAI